LPTDGVVLVSISFLEDRLANGLLVEGLCCGRLREEGNDGCAGDEAMHRDPNDCGGPGTRPASSEVTARRMRRWLRTTQVLLDPVLEAIHQPADALGPCFCPLRVAVIIRIQVAPVARREVLPQGLGLGAPGRSRQRGRAARLSCSSSA